MFDREQIIARTRAFFNPTAGNEPSNKAKAIAAIIDRNGSSFGCLKGAVREIVEQVLDEKLPGNAPDKAPIGVMYDLVNGDGLRLMLGRDPVDAKGTVKATVGRKDMREPTVAQINAFLDELNAAL